MLHAIYRSIISVFGSALHLLTKGSNTLLFVCDADMEIWCRQISVSWGGRHHACGEPAVRKPSA